MNADEQKEAYSSVRKLFNNACEEINHLRAQLTECQLKLHDGTPTLLLAAMAEITRLRAAIESAPHSDECIIVGRTDCPCDCWKHEALAIKS